MSPKAYAAAIHARLVGTAVLLGNASYALYLIHPIAIRAVSLLSNRLWHSLSDAGLFGLLLGLSLTVGLALHLAIERPFMAWSGRLARKSRVAA